MAERPSENLPDWLVSNPTHLSEPDGSRKSNGYEPEEPLPAQIFNWLWYSASLWLQYMLGLLQHEVDAVSTTYAITTTDDGKLFLLDSSAGAFTIDLPDPEDFEGATWRFKDISGFLAANPVTLNRTVDGEIDGLDADYLLEADFGTWTLYCDGIDFFFV